MNPKIHAVIETAIYVDDLDGAVLFSRRSPYGVPETHCAVGRGARKASSIG